MYESMPRGSPLDLPQANEIPSLKVAVAVLELPKGRVGGAGVENVAHWHRVSGETTEQGGGTDLCGIRTYSTVAQKMKCWCV